jgi:DNA repair exonuclease SbcCD ATPase subunit
MGKRKNNSTPLSLFSFQDMITGLCGIMILLVLIMVLDLVEARSNAKPSSNTVKEEVDLQALQKEVDELQKKYLSNQQALSSVVVQTNRNDLTEITVMTKNLTDQEKQILGLKSQVELLKSQLADRKKEKNESDRKLREMEEIRKQLEAAIAKTSENDLTIIPERGYNKMPIYVDCSGKTVKVHFPVQKKETILIDISNAAARLAQLAQSTDKEANYFVLLIRPSSLGYAFKLEPVLESVGFKVGRDPIPEQKVLKFAI